MPSYSEYYAEMGLDAPEPPPEKKKERRPRSGGKGSRSNRDLFTSTGKYPPRAPYAEPGGPSVWSAPGEGPTPPSGVTGIRMGGLPTYGQEPHTPPTTSPFSNAWDSLVGAFNPPPPATLAANLLGSEGTPHMPVLSDRDKFSTRGRPPQAPQIKPTGTPKYTGGASAAGFNEMQNGIIPSSTKMYGGQVWDLNASLPPSLTMEEPPPTFFGGWWSHGRRGGRGGRGGSNYSRYLEDVLTRWRFGY